MGSNTGNSGGVCCFSWQQEVSCDFSKLMYSVCRRFWCPCCLAALSLLQLKELQEASEAAATKAEELTAALEASQEALAEARALTTQQASRLSHLESEFEALQVMCGCGLVGWRRQDMVMAAVDMTRVKQDGLLSCLMLPACKYSESILHGSAVHPISEPGA